MAKKLVKNYVFNPGLGINDNARPNAVTLLENNKVFLQKEISAYIQAQVDAGNPAYTDKTYDIPKCERDAGYVIDALIFDIRYNGNEETRRISTYYWDQDVPQIQGNRTAEIESYTYAKNLINTYILTNTTVPNPEQSVATQYIDGGLTTETGTIARVTTLLDDVIDVISGGLDSLPTLTVGLGRIEVLGKIQLEEILVITNVTDNEIIYNFGDTARGGTVKFNAGNSEAYPQAFSINEGTTIVNFKYNTSSMANTDDIQIFLEDKAQKIQMSDITLDAMERIKVGIPQAMLDADFEYGLQPTKWQAIATERGYPSTYEIPASDIKVTQVSTDASTATNGIGSSLITVTTPIAHQFEAGDVITIRALSSSVIGFNRAEGTFIIESVPTNRTFTYYAKSKVGTTNGQVLATENTQLRRADFYTGAEVSNPTFSVPTQGGSGSFTTALDAPLEATNLTYIGNAPPIGIVLSGTDIATGTQVTGVFGGNNSDGIETTAFVANDFAGGSSSIELVDVTGISQGMIVSSDGTINGTQRIITSISNNILTLDGPLSAIYTGDNQAYTGQVLSTSNYIQGTATNAVFEVGEVAGVYSVNSITTAGTGYNIGDTLLISGTQLGGTSPDSDFYIVVSTVNETGGITGVQTLQDAVTVVTGTYTGVTASQTTPPALSNASIAVTKFAGTYEDRVSPEDIETTGSGFADGMRFTISGTNLGGSSPTNDAIITVSTFDGAVDDFSASGTSVRGDEINIYAGISISQPIVAPINNNAAITYAGLATIQVDFTEEHGLLPGSAIIIKINSTGSGHSIANGPYFINEVESLTRFNYIARTEGTVDVSTDDLQGEVYIRPDAFFSHRPYDGGVQLGTGSPQHGNQAIRMSKKYIRYQSGKGVMYNTGALFAPSFDISSMTSTGTTVGSIITVATDDSDHGLQSGAVIRISGSQTVGYDGDYTVTSIIDERTFRVEAQTALGDTTATLGSQCQMSLLYWHGAVVRSGAFDDQNGIFWQYDGQQMAVVRRTSTFQCAGNVSIGVDEHTLTGTNTRFFDQLQAGDRIVIKGMTHLVTHITSNTELSISPGFRGVSPVVGSKISKVQDLVIPQNEWNIDKCDGTGPSGYEIDVTKMQMIGIQFTWYGAGFIDWMLRGPDGNYIFCHRLKGNNLNTEAYMRTGNVPVRYEVTNESARNILAADINSTATTIELEDTTQFPTSGVVYIAPEVIRYTGKNDTTHTLTGCTRAASLTNFAGGSTRSYTGSTAQSHTAREGVLLISSTTSPIISHWGSAYLIDGQFDEDRGYIFSYAETNLEVDTTKKTAFMLRLAPSVSNAIVGDLGERELLNRAQLLLSSIEITSDGVDPDNTNAPIVGGIVVEGVLNPSNYPLSVADVNWSELSTQAQGGQPSFAQIAAGGGISWSSGTTQTEVTATVQGDMTTSLTISQELDANGGTRDDYFYITPEDFESSGIRVGAVCNTAPFNGATVVGFGQSQRYSNTIFVDMNRTATNEGQNYSGGSLTLNFTYPTTRTNSPTVFFTKTSWDNSGATLGTQVSTSDTNWPAGTIVNTATELHFGVSDYVEVTFNNSSTGTIQGGDTVTFLFGQPPYALPGETVFSFIAQPGERGQLDLTELKELTTTTLGGRGTFPNGPDVLAVNVYKVAGTATPANLLLRWGEAQA